jgi:hypothetical protein
MKTLAATPTEMQTEAPIDATRYRLGLAIWFLLVLNGLAFNTVPTLVPIPSALGKISTQGALALATILVLILNRRRLVRPNLFLTLYSLLAVSAAISSLRMEAGLGSLLRAGRFVVFVAVLWLLTPLWGRRDRVLLQWHITCLATVLGTVLFGLVVAPGRARPGGRLSGIVWPIPATQVGHYAAVLTGIVLVLLLAGVMSRRVAFALAVPSAAMMLLSHTRTALIGLIVGVGCAALTLFTTQRRARKAVITALVIAVLVATLFAGFLTTWFDRGQSAEQVGGFNGRKAVWTALLQAPRSELEIVIGKGLTNKSFNGLAIDNSWYSTYQDEGLVGVVLCAAILLALLMLATTRPRGPSLAVAVFIVVYCTIAATTETGLGDASPYILDLTVAAALLAPALTTVRLDTRTST